MISSMCPVCFKNFERVGEELYWHIKIENVNLEFENLRLEKAVLEKQYQKITNNV